MERPKALSRRELLRLGVAAGSGAIAGGILSRGVQSQSGGADSEAQVGTSEEISFEPVSPITYFQVRNNIEEVMNANANQILFDKNTGHLRIADATGNELIELPGNREIAGVFVSADDFSLSFEYRGIDGSNFGVRIGRSVRDGQLLATSWDTNQTSG